MRKFSPQDVDRRLGQQYAQWIKENPQSGQVFQDCQEAIESSLSILEHYNKISLAIKGCLSKHKVLVS